MTASPLICPFSKQLDAGMDQNFRELRIQRYFREVSWDQLKEDVKMTETQGKIKDCHEIDLLLQN
jgi:hypothetical protein